MDLKDLNLPNNLTAVQDDAATTMAPPPSYQASTADQPILNLSFTPLPPPPYPLTFLMEGEFRSPNFTVSIPADPETKPGSTRAKLFGRSNSSGAMAIPLATVETDSSLIHHHAHIHDARPGGVMYTLKRNPASSPPPLLSTSSDGGGGDDQAEWRYTITSHGAGGARLLEVITTPAILSAASTRLVFRRAADGELDALRLKTLKHGVQEGGLAMVLEYRGERVGEIVLLGARREKPVFRVVLERAGMDPLLAVVLALVVDDRWMGGKRRWKREFGRGLAGIGRGPGAGLAGAYAVGAG